MGTPTWYISSAQDIVPPCMMYGTSVKQPVNFASAGVSATIRFYAQSHLPIKPLFPPPHTPFKSFLQT